MNQRLGLEAAMIECQRLWDQTHDVDACVERFPHYERDIREYFALADTLAAVSLPPARERRRQEGWQELSTLVVATPRPLTPALRYAGAAAALVAGVLAVSA